MFIPSKDEKSTIKGKVKYPHIAASVKSRLLAHLEIPDDSILIQHIANILSKPRDRIKCKP